ncbi:phospholysine phosphohistidine inorganic pyrophosphate phosphatase-like [Neocloeon triangulifer]|uniref:phospholysine phosphohistidine inorganic pyrophosphate phosphatase-like n=1 Tax=Neocloeon triangulifer TaxID=2078957 RepID=UPI00286F4CBF|nr:phospholysine phosphohistidine inorganic pyrophosphate phosphatase-like [Neocloeon triangulifer]
MAAVEGVLLDITGVLKEGNSPIEGSVEAVQKLREKGLKIRFVTNETQETKRSLVSKLTNMGFSLSEDEVISPCPAMVHELQNKGLRPHLLVHPRVVEDFSTVSFEDPNCVVIGDSAEHFTYDNLNKAFRILMNLSEPILYSLGKGKYFKEDGELVLDVGSYAACLEFATGTKARIVGKPEPSFFRTALQMMQVDPEKAIMVGDDLISDVGGAQNCGIRGVLVRTGKFRPSDETHPEVKPFFIADNLSNAVSRILSM